MLADCDRTVQLTRIHNICSSDKLSLEINLRDGRPITIRSAMNQKAPVERERRSSYLYSLIPFLNSSSARQLNALICVLSTPYFVNLPSLTHSLHHKCRNKIENVKTHIDVQDLTHCSRETTLRSIRCSLHEQYQRVLLHRLERQLSPNFKVQGYDWKSINSHHR